VLPLRYTRGWRIASLLVLLAVLGATLTPAMGLFGRVRFDALFEFDKWLHGVTFCLLALWFTGLYARRAYWLIALGLLAFGGAIELVQRSLTYRSGDFADLTANAVGILLGLGFALAGLGGWSLRVESWLLERRKGA